MADTLILRKEHLKPFLRKIAKERPLNAPVKNHHGDTMLEVISSVDNVTLDLASRPIMPPKSFFYLRLRHYLPISATVQRIGSMKFSRKLFGLRSCDLWGILFLDMMFQENFKDRYYLNRRSNTVLINIGCNEPMESCFCRSIKSGPFLEYGYNLQLTDLGDRFFVEIGRPRGKALIDKWSYFFTTVTVQDREAQYEIVLEAESRF